MYTPKHFQITDNDEINAFIINNAFGQLISTSKARLCSSHVPFLLSNSDDFLLAHLAKQNIQLNHRDGQTVMVTL